MGNESTPFKSKGSLGFTVYVTQVIPKDATVPSADLKPVPHPRRGTVTYDMGNGSEYTRPFKEFKRMYVPAR